MHSVKQPSTLLVKSTSAMPHHLQILPVAVVADEPTDGIEGTARTSLDGGLDNILGRLILWEANYVIMQWGR